MCLNGVEIEFFATHLTVIKRSEKVCLNFMSYLTDIKTLHR